MVISMKRTSLLLLTLCLILALSGCQRARVPGLDWDAEEMVELRLQRVMYLVGEKTTQDTEEIQAVAEGLRSVPTLRERRQDDPLYDGAGSVTFTFTRADGSQEVVCYNGSSHSLSTPAGEFLVAEGASPTQDELWNLVDAPVEYPSESNHVQPDEETAEFFGF